MSGRPQAPAEMLKVERHGAVLLLTLNRAAKRNALHPDLIAKLSETLRQADLDPSINVVVLTGAGTTFCAGLDLAHLSSLEAEQKVEYMRSFFALFEQVYELQQVVIGAINGPAIAGGFDIAAACDLRLCTPASTFAQTELLLGITQILHPIYKVIGLGRAKSLALTAEPIGGADAYRIGLVTQVYPAEELVTQALRLAATLASRPREALLETKRLSREVIDLDTRTAFARMFDVISARLRSGEHQREIRTYLDRLWQERKP